MSSSELAEVDRTSRVQVPPKPHSSHPPSSPELTTEGSGEQHSSRRQGLRVAAAKAGRFLLHLLEMVVAMLVGMGLFSVLRGVVLKPLGYTLSSSSDPYLIGMAVFMVIPMIAWMRFRRMSWRPIAEMSAAMVALAILLVCAGWLGILPRSILNLLEHALMVPAMLVPMLLRLQYYTGSHTAHHAHTA